MELMNESVKNDLEDAMDKLGDVMTLLRRAQHGTPTGAKADVSLAISRVADAHHYCDTAVEVILGNLEPSR